MVFNYRFDIERAMQQVFHSLGERDRRLYAAVESAKLGHGGIGKESSDKAGAIPRAE